MYSILYTFLIRTTRGTRKRPVARWTRGARGHDLRWTPPR
jgi:hypothetical protein